MHGNTLLVYKISLVKLEGKRPLVRSRHRWEDNIEWMSEK